MAQAGYTPILIYGSGTASATPSSGNLTSSANGAELALNYTDGKLYYKDNAGVVQLLASKAGASGSVTSVAMTVPAFLSVAGSPITTSGTLAVTLSGTALPIANGGTGSTSTAYCSLTANVSGTLPIANGGTNATATPTAGAVAYGTGSAYAFTAAGTAGYILQSNGSGAPTWVAASTGTVTAVSVATSNGFAGSSSGGATPALTLSTTVTGVLKGNGTAISAAVSGADYAPATSGTSILYGNGSGGFSNVTVGTGLSFVAGTLSASGGTSASVPLAYYFGQS